MINLIASILADIILFILFINLGSLDKQIFDFLSKVACKKVLTFSQGSFIALQNCARHRYYF
jgi:hypothetical protein